MGVTPTTIDGGGGGGASGQGDAGGGGGGSEAIIAAANAAAAFNGFASTIETIVANLGIYPEAAEKETQLVTEALLTERLTNKVDPIEAKIEKEITPKLDDVARRAVTNKDLIDDARRERITLSVKLNGLIGRLSALIDGFNARHRMAEPNAGGGFTIMED